MKRFTISQENVASVLRDDESSAPESAVFHSEQELEIVSGHWPVARLLDIWNGLPGVAAIRAVTRIWKRMQSLEPAEFRIAVAAPEGILQVDDLLGQATVYVIREIVLPDSYVEMWCKRLIETVEPWARSFSRNRQPFEIKFYGDANGGARSPSSSGTPPGMWLRSLCDRTGITSLA